MWKRFFIPFALSILFVLPGKAQTEFRPEWSFGVNGGATLSRMYFTPRVQQTLLQQFSGGLSARYITEKNCGLLLELNISQRGWEEKVDAESHPNLYSRSLTYLELPVLTHIYFDMSKRFRGVFHLGPQFSYLLDEKELDRNILDTSDPESIEYYDLDVQRKFDYGILGGAGLELRTPAGSFILEGRYYFGLGSIFKDSKADYFQNSLNQVIGIKLTYLFN